LHNNSYRKPSRRKAVKQKRKKRHKRERGGGENGEAMRACSEETARPTGQQTNLDGEGFYNSYYVK